MCRHTRRPNETPLWEVDEAPPDRPKVLQPCTKPSLAGEQATTTSAEKRVHMASHAHCLPVLTTQTFLSAHLGEHRLAYSEDPVVADGCLRDH